MRSYMAALLLPLTLLAAPNFSKHLLFKLDFENGTRAAVAQGQAEGTFQGQGTAKFTQGYNGNGFLTGAKAEGIRFMCQGNLKGKKGTLVFWQKKLDNVEFNTNDKAHHIFVELYGANRRTIIYKYGECFRPWVLEYYRKDTKNLDLKLMYPDEATYDKLAWHQYAYTWDEFKEAFYMDGQLCEAGIREAPFEDTTVKDHITFGQNRDFGGPAESNRIMDDIAIYDTPFNATEIYALYRSELKTPPLPKVTVIPTETPLALDGNFDEPIYARAAAIPMLYNASTNSVAEVPSILYFSYDKENFYVSMKAPVGSEAFERAHTALLKGMFMAERKSFDLDIDNDDSLLIDIFRDGMYFYLAANTIDVRYDYSVLLPTEKISLDWNPAWRVGSRMTSEGWQVECAIPRKEVHIDGALPLTFQANFMRNWKLLKQESDSLSQYESAPRVCFNRTPKRYAELTFDADTVSVAFNELSRFDRNGADFKAGIANTSKAAQKVLAEFFSGRAVIASKVFDIPAGGSALFEYKGNFTVQQNSLGFRVRSENGKKTYFHFENPVFAFEDIQLNIVSLPSAGKLELNGNFAQLNLDLSKTRVEVSVSQGEKSVFSKSFGAKSLSFAHSISVKDWADGEYDVVVSVKENGKVLATRSCVFTKTPLPDWYGTNVGVTDKVPRPWTPIKVDGSRLCMLNTTYDFADNPFPASVIAGGEEILRAPIAMRVTTANGSGKLKVKNSVKNIKDGEVTVIGKGRVAGLKVTVKTTVEFDGYMWHEVTVAPEEGRVTVKSIQIDIPLKEECCELIVPYDYTLSQTGKLTTWHGHNRPLWVGNADRGIAFLAEHTHNWNLKNSADTLEAKGGAKGYIHLNLADKDFELNKAERYEFSLQATPSKPMHKDYRKLRFIAEADKNDVFAQEQGADFIVWWVVGWGKVSQDGGEVCYPFTRKGARKEGFRKTFNDNTICEVPYFQLHETWGDAPEYAQFAYEWVRSRNLPVIQGGKSNNRSADICQNSSSFQDFTLFHLAKCIRDYNWRGMYFDMSQPQNCTNRRHGCGYVKDGQVLPTTNYRGTRRLVKRIYTILSEINEYPMIVYHNSGQICPQVHGFAGAFVDGENFNARLKDNRGYEEILRPDVFRAEYRCHNFGAQGAMLPEFRISNRLRKAMNDKKFDVEAQREYDELACHENYLFGLALLHDSQMSTAYMYHYDVKFNAYKILRDMNYSEGKLKFIPYWKQKVATLDENRGIASFYVGDGYAVAVLMNLGTETADFKLELNCGELGLTPATAVNMQYSEAVNLNGNVLEISGVPAKQYRAIMLKK